MTATITLNAMTLPVFAEFVFMLAGEFERFEPAAQQTRMLPPSGGVVTVEDGVGTQLYLLAGRSGDPARQALRSAFHFTNGQPVDRRQGSPSDRAASGLARFVARFMRRGR